MVNGPIESMSADCYWTIFSGFFLKRTTFIQMVHLVSKMDQLTLINGQGNRNLEVIVIQREEEEEETNEKTIPHTSGTIRKQHIKTLINTLTQKTQRRNIKYDATPEPKWPVFWGKKNKNI